MKCIKNATSIISSVLHHHSLSNLHYLQANEIYQEFKNTAEDYMTMLCYTLLHVESKHSYQIYNL